MDRIWYITCSKDKNGDYKYIGYDNDMNEMSTKPLNSLQLYQYLNAYFSDNWYFFYDYEKPLELEVKNINNDFNILFIFNKIPNIMLNYFNELKCTISNPKLQTIPPNNGISKNTTPYNTECHLVIESSTNREDCNIYSWSNFLYYLDNSFISDANLINDGLTIKQVYFDNYINKYTIRNMTIYINDKEGKKLFFNVINEMSKKDKVILQDINHNINIPKVDNFINKVISYKESNICNNEIPRVFSYISSLETIEDYIDAKITVNYYKKYNEFLNISESVKYIIKSNNLISNKEFSKVDFKPFISGLIIGLVSNICLGSLINMGIDFNTIIETPRQLLSILIFFFGNVSSISLFYIGINKVVENKNSNKNREEFLKYLDNTSVIDKVLVEDKFLNYINELNDILKNHPNKELCILLNSLIKEYKDSIDIKIKTDKEIDYSNLIVKYLNIKGKIYKEIYHKNIDINKEQNNMFKEFGIINKSIEDIYLQTMFNEIIKIRNNPYPDSNKDIKKLLELASRYCTSQTNVSSGLTLEEEKTNIIREMTDLIMSREEILRKEVYRNSLVSEYEEIEKYAIGIDEFSEDRVRKLKRE